MIDSLMTKPSFVLANERAQQLILHLLRYPADLVDMRLLMRRFQASVAEVQQALHWLDTHSSAPEEKAPGQ